MAASLRLTSVTIGSPAPRELARFYADLLGEEVAASDPARPGEPDDAGWAQLRSNGITLNFEWESQWRTPAWPARPGEQFASQHLDIHVDDLDAAVASAIERGARLAEEQPQPDVRVMLDPAGHPFCLFA